MVYKISQHAQERILHRNISNDVLDDVINEPDFRVKERKCVWIYQKKFQEKDKVYLYRVYSGRFGLADSMGGEKWLSSKKQTQA